MPERNPKRFPEEFCFQLTKLEYGNKKGGRRYMPYVFTEQGVAMLSAVLKSVAEKLAICHSTCDSKCMVTSKVLRARLLSFKPWIMACFVVLLGALAVYFYLQAQALGLQSTASTESSTEPTSPQPPLTYMDPVHNITFEYPGNWLLRRPVDTNGPNPCCNISFTDGDDTLLRVSIFENEYASFVQKITMVASSKPEPVTAYAFPGVLLTHDLGGEYILNVAGRTLDLQYFVINQERQQEIEDSLNHILSTLKLTNLPD